MSTIQREIVNVELLDGREFHDIEIIPADHKLWELTRHRHKWPKTQDAPMLFAEFCAWAALYRRGEYPQSHDQFMIDARRVSYADESGDPVDPTDPASLDD